MKTAIITYIDDNVSENFEKDFLYTLRDIAKYNGKVYVIYYGKNKRFIEKIKRKYRVNVIPAIKRLKVSNQRNMEIVNVIDNLPKDISNIMCIDGGDVWFQNPIDGIFELTENSYGFVEENENENADDRFNLFCINQIKDKKLRNFFFKKAKGFKLVNSGMIVGRKDRVRNILKNIAELTQKINQNFFALDQVIFNYFVREDGRGIIIPRKYNYSLITNTNQFIIKNSLFYDENNELIVIVHNSGSVSRLFPNGRRDIKSVPKFEKKLPGTFWGITTFFNPARYKNKIKNYKRFREHTKMQGLNLLTVELAFGDRPFELNKNDADILIQLRTNSILWQKERMLNIGLKNLPDNCDKFAWLDADIRFCNDNWIKDTCRILESYVIVQPFESVIRLPRGIYYMNPKKISFSLDIEKEGYKSYGMAYRISQLGKRALKNMSLYGLSGLAWAARRDVFEKNGLFDKSIFPFSDLFMAHSFYNTDDFSADVEYFINNDLVKACFLDWAGKIRKIVKDSVYFTEGSLLHFWHGYLKNKNYPECKRILNKYNFNPDKDIKIDSNGCWVWGSEKPKLHKELERYFFLRNEEESIFNEFSNIFIKFKTDFYYKFDRCKGLLGIFLLRNYPDIFFKLKKVEDFITPLNEDCIRKILKDKWIDYKSDNYPKDRRMEILKENDIECMSTENICFLINDLVRMFAKNGTYLEVGTYKGGSLLSAALFNQSIRCIGIDNFSQFNEDLNTENTFRKNLANFKNPKNIEFYNGNYKTVIKEIFLKEPNLKINVYFYDGDHSYKNQITGLNLMLPYFAEKCLIFVDDINWKRVEKANKDFIRQNPDFKSVFKIKTKGNCSKNWWNGIEILARGL